MPLPDPAADLLPAILKDLPIGVGVARAPGGELVYANATFTALMGMDVRAGADLRAAGRRLRTRDGQPYPEDRLPFVRALARGEMVVSDDVFIDHDDGRRLQVRAFGKPILDAAGQVRMVVLALLDITAEAEAAAAHVIEQHKLQVALQHAPIILFACDVGGVVTVSEGAGLQRMGFKSGELVGQSIYQLYKDQPEILRNHERVLAGETFTTVADLGTVVLESWMAPMRGPDGAIGGVIGISTDVTERLRMQRQVDRAERLAALGRLAASVGHEINNPLAYASEALRMARDLVGSGAPDGAKLGDLLRDAWDGLERVRLITRDLKTFTRSEEDARRPLDINRAVGAAAKMVANRTAPRARIELQLGPAAVVEADENRLVQIFVNLILNAADALPPDGAARNRIAIGTRREDGRVVVDVADNGPGVPLELRDRVFEPFFTTKPVGEGTGLGLFVTRNLVEALGGTVALTEAPGGGALFSIRLPLSAAAPAVVAPDAPSAVAPGARARVLIIDDEPQLGRLFKATLVPDYEVDVFTGGRAALQHLVQSPPYDLILCDLMMADLSGMKVYEEIRRARPGLERAFVFMTGGVFDPEAARFLASVDNPCVDKPFDVRAEVARRLGHLP